MNPLTTKVRAVIRREYLQRVKSRWFLVSTIGLPLLIIGLMLLGGFLTLRGAGDVGSAGRSIGVADPTGLVAEPLIDELRGSGFLPSRAAAFEDVSPTEARTGLIESDYDLVLLLPADVVAAPEGGPARGRAAEALLLARDNVSEGARRAVREALRNALVRTRLERAGYDAVDPAELLRTTPIDIVNVAESGEARSQELFQIISFVIAFAFYMILLIYGQMIIRAIIEEKASDIVEVMVSSLRPWELMLGKIIGVGAVGLTQIAIWGLIIAAGTAYGLTSGSGALAQLGISLSAFAIPWGRIVLVLLFLAMGYLLYAGLFAGVGATISSEQDAQQAALPVTMLIIVAFIAIQGVLGSPNAGWAVIVSLIPFFSPLVMSSRVFITDVPIWEWSLALALLVLCVLGTAWLAGRIYRVGILMKGQRASLPEVVRWVRHG
ncbi:MAG: ABC transporter permease [Gemmatimonadota bacterium]|nr:ABC transporter permease [Gemmatimonadota bacterium]